jgi:adenylate cyclase
MGNWGVAVRFPSLLPAHHFPRAPPYDLTPKHRNRAQILGGLSVRVRAGGGTGYVTIKGRRTGYARPEFEYEIPVDDANTMIDTLARGRVVQKTRYRILHRDLIWEVDEFHGANAGLVIAEVELEDEAQPFEKPEWVGDDVTLDNRYANSRLAIEPYREWREKG